MPEQTKQFDAASTADRISEAMEKLYATFYGHERGKAVTYINGKTVLCMIEGSRSAGEAEEIAMGDASGVIDRRVAFQVNQEDAFTRMVEEITDRKVVAFLSANQENLTFAAELFVLDREPN